MHLFPGMGASLDKWTRHEGLLREEEGGGIILVKTGDSTLPSVKSSEGFLLMTSLWSGQAFTPGCICFPHL